MFITDLPKFQSRPLMCLHINFTVWKEAISLINVFTIWNVEWIAEISCVNDANIEACN